MEQKRFIEEGNFLEIDDICKSPKILMFRYNALVDFCANEPPLIHVYENDNSQKVLCESIFRQTIDIPNDYFLSYTIYSNQRDNFGDNCYFVVRKIIWDKQKDQNEIKHLGQSSEMRDKLLKMWPSIKSNTIFCFNNNNLIELLIKIDELIKHGISLDNRIDQELPSWSDIEIMRRYDWGEIRSSWGATMQNIQVEQLLQKNIDILEFEMARKHAAIKKLELDYRFPLDLYKNILCE